VSELYQRPSRDQIAARVTGSLPGAQPRPEPPKPPNYLERYGIHLRARMRALGIDQAALQERTGLSPHIAARAINATAADIGTAAAIAAAVGSDLLAMLAPYQCGTCKGSPYDGFTCNECGAEGARK